MTKLGNAHFPVTLVQVRDFIDSLYGLSKSTVFHMQHLFLYMFNMIEMLRTISGSVLPQD